MKKKRDILFLCQFFYPEYLEVGSVVLEGPGKDMLRNPKVREAYLGG